MSEKEIPACPFCGKESINTDRAFDTNCTNRECAIYGINIKMEHWLNRPIESAIREEIISTWKAATKANGQTEAYRIIQRMVDRLRYGRTENNPSSVEEPVQVGVKLISDIRKCRGYENLSTIMSDGGLGEKLYKAVDALENIKKNSVHGRIVAVGNIEALDDKPGMVISCSMEELRGAGRNLAFRDIVVMLDPERGKL